MKKYFFCFLFIFLLGGITSCFKESFLPIKASFEIVYLQGRQAAPALVKITNDSEGAESYLWTVQGANIQTSTERNIPELLYTKAGKYKITLEVTNQDGLVDKKEAEVVIGDVLVADFTFVYDVNNFAPAKVVFANKSVSGQRYEWSFTGADVVTSTAENPTITFLKEGTHTAILKVFSGESFTTKEIKIPVRPNLEPQFSFAATDFNFEMEAPLTIRVTNTSKGSINQKWAVNDAASTVQSVLDSITLITLKEAKTYRVSLVAGNGKETKTIEKEIIVKPNSNLLTFENVKIGTYTNSTLPSYYVSRRNLGIGKQQIDTLSFGKELDIVFFSRDTDFTYARFVSPNRVQEVLMQAIPQATRTIFINVLEDCVPCTKLTLTQFNAIKKASDFDAFIFRFGDGVVEGFSRSKGPRFVPFLTQDNRRGIIYVKEFVSQGSESYIVADIKVWRKP
jgi:PKD repeat protein